MSPTASHRALALALSATLTLSALPVHAQQGGSDPQRSIASTPTSCEDAVAQQVREQCPKNAARACAEAVRQAVEQVCSPQQQQAQLQQQAQPLEAGGGAPAETTVLGVPVLPLGVAALLGLGLAIGAGGGGDGDDDVATTPSHSTPSHH